MNYVGIREKGFASTVTAFQSDLWQDYILNLEHDKVLRAQIYR
jgi:hypothetical protein